jgi:hypothetical protein
LAGETFGRLQDSELEIACVQAYNDWLIDEWAGASDRFIPQCLVPIWPVEAAIAEIKRAVGRGHRGVILPSLPMHLRKVPHISGPEYDPLWSACEELGVPVCLHAGGSPELQSPLPPNMKPALAAAVDAATKPVSSVFVISLYSFSRVLLRHPKLRLVLAESALSWGMLYLEWADHQFEHDGLSGEGYDLGTVVSMSHVTGRGWVAYTKRDDITGSTLERLNAWHVTGPWHVATQQWPATPAPGCGWTYSAQTHPASPAPAGTMLVSWASSHDDPGTTCDMRPQFTYLPIGSPLPSRAGGPHRAAASGGRGNEPERKASE